jgi:hypothetical protein
MHLHFFLLLGLACAAPMTAKNNEEMTIADTPYNGSLSEGMHRTSMGSGG